MAVAFSFVHLSGGPAQVHQEVLVEERHQLLPAGAEDGALLVGVGRLFVAHPTLPSGFPSVL